MTDEDRPLWADGPRRWTIIMPQDELEVTFEDWGGGDQSDAVLFGINIRFNDGQPDWRTADNCWTGFSATRRQMIRIAKTILAELDDREE